MAVAGDETRAEPTTQDREIVVSRVIDAPQELVFEAFTEVRHLSQGWGPDGTDYQEWITWTEIAPPERIALRHRESRDDPNAFESVVTLAADGTATRIEMRMVFPTKELRDEAAEKYHAIEGGRQPLAHLAAYVTDRVRNGVEDGWPGRCSSASRCRWTGSSRPSPSGS